MNVACGVLNIAKPPGLTSRKVVDRVQKLVQPAKAGHAGTLDPLATGVLLVCVGRATRLISHVQQQRKHYQATFLLGRRSETDDVTGEMVETPGFQGVARERLEELLPEFLGRIEQVPPKFSAVHVDGQRAYRLAREGRDVELKPRTVVVKSLELREFDGTAITLDTICGSGTYVRSIGRDVGERLGCGAVMSALVRTRIGSFDLAGAVAFDDLHPETWEAHLLPARACVSGLPVLACDAPMVERLRHGRSVTLDDALRNDSRFKRPKPPEVAAVGPAGDLVAILEPAERDVLKPKLVLI